MYLHKKIGMKLEKIFYIVIAKNYETLFEFFLLKLPSTYNESEVVEFMYRNQSDMTKILKLKLKLESCTSGKNLHSQLHHENHL